MRADHWNDSDEHVVEKTGKKIAHWMQVLDAFKAGDKKSNDVVAQLQQEHHVPRYWACTITTHYLKKNSK